MSYYMGGAVATLAVGLVAAILVLGGTGPGRPPNLQLPHPSGPPGIIGPAVPPSGSGGLDRADR